MTTFIALLRGINVSGHNMIPMVGLRELCSGLGYDQVATYIQSGNVVFTGAGKAAAVESILEEAIEKQFGFNIPVIVRMAEQWPSYLKGNPFPELSEREPNHVLMGLSKARPAKGAVAALRERATAGEQIEMVGDALWIYFADSIARSKLSPAVLDRLVGSSVTARNWRTVQQLASMAKAAVPRGREPGNE